MKVLFCFYPLFVHYNHGIALLSALCKQRGIDTALYMLDSVASFQTHLAEHHYDFVAFSAVVERDYCLSIPFMAAAKRQGKTVLLGGVYPRRGLSLADAPADFICCGEGETLPDFILHGDDRLFRERMIHPDLNNLPLPDYELFEGIPFDREMPFFKNKTVLPYYTSRGCPWPCSFCEVRLQAGAVRYRHKAGADLRYLARQYQPDLFMIGDETLPYYSQEWRESWGDFSYPFVAYTRADAPLEMIEWMKRRGMVGCAFGVESGDEGYRNAVLHKDLTDRAIYRTVEALQRLDIPYAPFFMVNTPGETFGIKACTHKMAREIGGFPVIFAYENLAAERKGVKPWLQS